MKLLICLLLLCGISGCGFFDPECRPCLENKVKGFQMFKPSVDGLVPASHCIPCSDAKSAEARFICFGERPK